MKIEIEQTISMHVRNMPNALRELFESSAFAIQTDNTFIVISDNVLEVINRELDLRELPEGDLNLLIMLKEKLDSVERLCDVYLYRGKK